MKWIPIKLFCFVFCILIRNLCHAADSPLGANLEPSIVPAVQQWHGGAGTLALGRKLEIQVDTKDQAALNGVARLLQNDLTAIGYVQSAVNDSGKLPAGSIFLMLEKSDPVPTRLVDQAYRLRIDDSITITAKTPTGVFYGTRTLLQMLQQSHDGTLSKGMITDYPRYAGRMLMLDVARKPYPVATLKDFMRIMAWYKMNELHLHLSDESRGDRYAAFRIQSKKFPGLTAKDLFYTWEDLRDLQDFAKARGITITPEIDMPGHARCLTNYWPELVNPKLGKSSLDIFNPKTTETMAALLDEIIPLFDAPDFHIGTDEYRMGGLNKEEREKAGEAFRKFINAMNAVVRAHGKNCRIWSGYEGMSGTTMPDPTVIVDMWFNTDPLGHIAQGHKVINSDQGRTYLVPGAHYYGVNNAGVYDNWEPCRFSGDTTKNPAPDDPHLLGGKLHVWGDQGPAGYTLTEIADLTLPSIQAFSEKLWGRKGSANYGDFQMRVVRTEPVPGIKVLDRMVVENRDGIVLNLSQEMSLGSVNSSIALPLAKVPRADLEFPWTLSLEVRKAADTPGRGVILGSDLVELCADFSCVEQRQTKGSDGKLVKKNVTLQGIGLVRAAGAFGKDPADSIKADQVSRVYSEPLTLQKWTRILVVGQRGRTIVYVDGVKTGESNNQMVCPLRRLGSLTGQTFVGQVRNLTVWNRVVSAKEAATNAKP